MVVAPVLEDSKEEKTASLLAIEVGPIEDK